jgi:predicted transcriptional regulator
LRFALSDTVTNKELLQMTTDIVSSHLANSQTEAPDIPDVIKQVYKTLSSVSGEGGRNKDRPSPSVPIKKSVMPDYIVCLEDGKHLKMLKRHLKSVYNLTPEEYRERWGLPVDYPMVAPNYAEKRSQLAKDIGLGTKN